MTSSLFRILGPIVLVSLCACPTFSAVAGPDDRYSVITIINQTPYRVDYSHKWGTGEYHGNSFIKPNGTYRHWWTFDYSGQDYAPWFYIELNGDNASYKLRSFYSPDTDAANGRVYYIRWNTISERFHLVGKLYTN
jgi:hypothetical protein